METVKDYYGKQLKNSDDLQVTGVTSCSRKTQHIPAFVKDALKNVHEDIMSRAFGCATAYPEALVGAKILDLGSGCGRDCFVLSQLVGENGKVVGLDMTDELLEFSRNKVDYHTKVFGYTSPNVEFVKGYLEKMEDAGLEDNFFDVIVSNCVICLCRDKKAVLAEAYRVLKPGGEIYFSDMYRDGQLPPEVLTDEVLWCEGLIGSLGYKDLHDIAKKLGFSAPRMVKAENLPVLDPTIKARLGNCRYAAVTFRLYKRPEKSLSIAPSRFTYKGGIQGYEEEIKFDHNYTFKNGTATVVDGELADILQSSRFNSFFEKGQLSEKVDVASLNVDPFKIIQEKSTNGRDRKSVV